MMLGFDGFRLVKDTGSGVVTLDVPRARVEWKPKERWRVEKQNAFDPTIVLRRGRYHEDDIDCVAILWPAESNALRDFLNTDEGDALFIIYDYDNSTRHFPVAIDKLPPASDEAREFRQEIKLSFTALYDELPSLPDEYLSGIELEEGDGLFELEESNDKILLEEQ